MNRTVCAFGKKKVLKTYYLREMYTLFMKNLIYDCIRCICFLIRHQKRERCNEEVVSKVIWHH